jgi:DNA polymerase-3 subunit delta'
MLIGHQKIWQYLKRSAANKNLPHALMFCGREKLGKKKLAFEFASYLIGENVEKKQHPDFIFIEPKKPDSASAKASADRKAATSKEEIQISQVRELIWKLSLKPSAAPVKVAIIDRAHYLNDTAQSALLKTLEEPKGAALLILITEFPEMLFSTILSRLQKINFHSVKTAEIENFLKERKLGQKEREEILAMADGQPGFAIDLVNHPEKLKEREEKIRELEKITAGDLNTRFQYVKNISQDNEMVKETLAVWLSYFRKIFLQKCLAGDIRETEKLKNVIKTAQNADFLISTTNANSRLVLENLMLEL